MTPAQTVITTTNVTDEAAQGEASEEDAMSDDEDSAMLMLMESDVSLPRGKLSLLYFCIAECLRQSGNSFYLGSILHFFMMILCVQSIKS